MPVLGTITLTPTKRSRTGRHVHEALQEVVPGRGRSTPKGVDRSSSVLKGNPEEGRHMTSRHIVLASLVAALALLVAAPSFAGRVEGDGSSAPRGGGSSTSTSATLTASPNPVAAWSQYWLSGCGYVVGKQVTIVINNGTFFGAAVDANGCLAPVSWWASGAGSYRIDGYQKLKGRKQTLMATTMLSVT